MKIGYIPDVKQMVLLSDFELDIKEKVDFDYLDDMMESVFTLKEHYSLLKYDYKKDYILALIERYFLLSNLIHSYSGMPIFDIGKIESVKKVNLTKDVNKLYFKAYIPYLPYINLNFRITIYNISRTIFMLIISKNEEKLYSFLEQTKSNIEKIRELNQQNNSTIPILKAAFDKDIPFMKLTNDIYQLGWGVKSCLIQISSVDGDSFIGTSISRNKRKTSLVLKNAGIPVAKSKYIQEEKELISYAKEITWPVVIKPLDRGRSEGVTTNILDEKTLKSAYLHAKKFSNNIMIEKHTKGDVYRIGLIHNQLILCSKRLPKGIFGDGKSTIETIIDKENIIENKKVPWLRTKLYPKDKEAIDVLKIQGYTLETILKKEEFASLRVIPSDEDGGSAQDFFEHIHPENIKLAQKISRLLRLKSIGIDIISEDLAKPWYENGAKILEVNCKPAIANQYQPWRTKRTNIFLEKIFQQNSSRIPISVYIGGEKAWEISFKKYKKLNKKTNNAFITNHLKVYDNNEDETFFEVDDFYQRCQILLKDVTLGHLFIVIQTNELYKKGIPFDKISSFEVVEERILDFNTNNILEPKETIKIIDFFKNFLKKIS